MVSFQSATEFYEEYQDKISTLKAKFEGYTVEISEKRIQDYLCQFELNHKPIALKMLERVDYYSNARTSRLIKKLGNKLKGGPQVTRLKTCIFVQLTVAQAPALAL